MLIYEVARLRQLLAEQREAITQLERTLAETPGGLLLASFKDIEHRLKTELQALMPTLFDYLTLAPARLRAEPSQ